MSLDIVEILREPGMTKVCAPMVRYSKLGFRELVRRYNADVCFTPMILADSFVQSEKARDNEFTTNDRDEPVIVQFAAKKPDDFVQAAEMVSPYCNGVDLNCGCPQRWAIKDGYGVDLLTKPELVRDLVLQVRNRISSPFSVSVKIRLLQDIHKSIELCQTLEAAGVSFLTVHARTPEMRKEPIDLESLKLLRDCVKVPMIANGDIKSLQEARNLFEESKCEGIMVANGLLTNPALFAGESSTPLSCIQDWIDITSEIPTNFMTMHHHLVFMLEKILPKSQRLIFNNLQTEESVLNFLDSYYNIQPRMLNIKNLQPTDCVYKPRKRIDLENNQEIESDSSFELLSSLFDENSSLSI